MSRKGQATGAGVMAKLLSAFKKKGRRAERVSRRNEIRRVFR